MSSRPLVRPAVVLAVMGAVGAVLARGGVAIAAASRPAAPTVPERRHALIIGYNGAPVVADGEPPPPLKFADDDALAFFELEREIGDDAILLTISDADTRRHYPETSSLAVPPTLARLDEAVERLRAAMEDDARAGKAPVLIFFYSGHGARDASGQASLTLFDGGLSRSSLYQRVLDRLPARVIHIVIDACHAEAVVRTRDAEAGAVVLTPKEVEAYLSQATLARYPHAGLVIASSGDTESHEWDLYQSGVFTHEVVSGLRGAADVNGDGRVEYSELAAFLAAANQDVQDPRARLHTIVQPPEAAVHTTLVDLRVARASPTGTGWLTAVPRSAGRFFVEDTRGTRLADGHAELGFAISLLLPAEQALFLRSGDREAHLVLKAGDERPFDSLTFRRHPVRERGAIDSSLRAGLFATAYGPAYYNGYVGRSDVTAVSFATRPDATEEKAAPHARLRFALATGGAALLASSVTFSALSWGAWSDFQHTSYQKEAAQVNDRFQLDTGLAIGFFVLGAACAATAYLLGRNDAH